MAMRMRQAPRQSRADSPPDIGSLASGEARFALFHEGGDPLAIIVRKTELAHRVALPVELGAEALAPAFAEHRLDPGKAERRTGGEAPGQRVHLGVERLVLHRLPDQPPFGRPLGLARLAGPRPAERPRLADQPRRPP